MSDNARKILLASCIALGVVGVVLAVVNKFSNSTDLTMGYIGINLFAFSFTAGAFFARSAVSVIGGLLVLMPMCIIGTFFPDFLALYILLWGAIAIIGSVANWLGCSFIAAGLILVGWILPFPSSD